VTSPEPARFRRHFPVLGSLVYLASCSLGAPSTEAGESLAGMFRDMSRPRSAWQAFEEQMDGARRRFAALIGARTDEVALVPNASVGAYQVASGMNWRRRPGVVTTRAEFPSVAHVWLAQRANGAQVRFADQPRAASYLAAIDEPASLVSVPLVTYQDGARLPVAQIASAAHAAGARVFVDAYQALGTQPVRVADLGCDYLVGGSMKYLLGLPGAAFLYRRSGLSEKVAPQLTGWFGRRDPFAFDPAALDFADGARRFETGTPAVPALYAANAGMDLIAGLDLAEVRTHIETLSGYAIGRLAEAGESVRLRDDPGDRGAHIALADPNAARTGAWLAERGIAVSPRGDVLRLSIHYYTSAGDIDAVCEQLKAYRQRGQGGGNGAHRGGVAEGPRPAHVPV
jgi:selenocysteine lyase/cysteine desulfurase